MTLSGFALRHLPRYLKANLAASEMTAETVLAKVDTNMYNIIPLAQRSVTDAGFTQDQYDWLSDLDVIGFDQTDLAACADLTEKVKQTMSARLHKSTRLIVDGTLGNDRVSQMAMPEIMKAFNRLHFKKTLLANDGSVEFKTRPATESDYTLFYKNRSANLIKKAARVRLYAHGVATELPTMLSLANIEGMAVEMSPEELVTMYKTLHPKLMDVLDQTLTAAQMGMS